MKFGGWVVMLTVMIVFLTFIGLPTGLTSIINSVGININSTSAELISADVESSSLWDKIFGSTNGIIVLLIASGGAIVIGLFAKGYDVSLVIAPLIILVGGLFIGTFWGIIKFVSTFNQWWMTSIIVLVFSGLGIGFAIACVDYFAGR